MNETAAHKAPKKMLFWMIVTYVSPCILYPIVSLVTGAMTFYEVHMTFLNPILWVFELCLIGLAVASYSYQNKRLASYDGSEESIDSLNRFIQIFEKFSLIVPTLGFLCLPPIFNYGITKLHHIQYEAFLGGSPIGYSFTLVLAIGFEISVFSYINYMQVQERSITWLPFETRHTTMTITWRVLAVLIFTITGIVLMAVSCLLVPGNVTGKSMSSIIMLKIVPLAVFGGLLTLVDMSINMKDITDGIQDLNQFTDALSDRNYTVDDLQVKLRCELGTMVNDLNHFRDETRDILMGFQNSAKNSTRSAETLNSSMSLATESVRSINENIDLVQQEMKNQSAGVDEANASASQILVHISQLNENITNQVAGINESSAAVDEMVANIRSVTQVLEKNSQAVQNLSAASDEGRKSVQSAVQTSDSILKDSAGLLEASKIIQTIASQTNLLAMNAAIESAHAGEAGKGFAVVADEIRKLAEQSNNQGKAINQSLKRLSSSIEHVSETTREVQKNFEVIYGLAMTVRDQESVVMNAMNEQATGNRQVLEAMNQINSITNNVQEGAEEMLSGGEQIVKEMEILSSVTRLINEKMGVMSDSVGQITGAMDEVSVSSKKTHDDIILLDSALQDFTLRKEE